MIAGRTIDYDALAQNAMRGVVRTILTEVAKNGLPGDHHFYVSFDTQAAGVSVSRRLKDKYPDEMTIVLQHRFWDLSVTDDRFEVKLTFDGIPERLVVPFAALRVFYDPSVRYALQFEEAGMGHAGAAPEAGDPAARALMVSVPSEPSRPGRTSARTGERKPRPQRKPRIEKPADGERPPVPGNQAAPPAKTDAPAASQPPASALTEAGSKQPGKADAEADKQPAGAGAKEAGGAQIVSLDAFRKK